MTSLFMLPLLAHLLIAPLTQYTVNWHYVNKKIFRIEQWNNKNRILFLKNC